MHEAVCILGGCQQAGHPAIATLSDHRAERGREDMRYSSEWAIWREIKVIWAMDVV